MTGAPSIGELSVEDARARMLAAAPTVRTETIRLNPGSIGRVLAEPIIATRDQPPFDASAMDGWAIVDTASPGIFSAIGESAAGAPFDASVSGHDTVRIFTGAEVPAGCRIVVQEAAERVDGGVRLTFDADAPKYVRRRGGDFAKGATLLNAGTRLDPWRLALAASAGQAEAMVAMQPRVCILPTGAEIVAAGDAVRDDQIFDAAGPALAALVKQRGGAADILPAAGDTETSILASMDQAKAELVVTIGGASVGDHDLVKPALRRLGLELIVDTVRTRPGKPVWFGVLADGRRVLGLPGNPASALVCAELFLRPLMMAWQGADAALPMRRARLASALPKGGPRELWMRAVTREGVNGVLEVSPLPDQESSLVTVFAAANALLRRPIGAPPALAGDTVDMLALERL